MMKDAIIQHIVIHCTIQIWSWCTEYSLPVTGQQIQLYPVIHIISVCQGEKWQNKDRFQLLRI